MWIYFFLSSECEGRVAETSLCKNSLIEFLCFITLLFHSDIKFIEHKAMRLIRGPGWLQISTKKREEMFFHGDGMGNMSQHVAFIMLCLITQIKVIDSYYSLPPRSSSPKTDQCWLLLKENSIQNNSLGAHISKMTRETPDVRSDIRKPREDRQNHRYHR